MAAAIMADKWEGFTDDDIKFYLNTISGSGNKTREIHLGHIKPKVRETRLKSQKTAPIVNNLPESAFLLKQTQSKPHVKDESLPASNDNNNSKHDKTVTNATEPDMTPLTICKDDKVDPNHNNESTELYLDRQKMLEEQNRQKKNYLAKILLDRKKQTDQEAKRLQQIQGELHKLDILLSDDVSILRDQIEVASREFGEAQKRFNRAEKEFLDAKQSLFTKMERKELLTKHLCTIIEQNELRKAQKLSELMNKLSVPESADFGTPETPPASPKSEEPQNSSQTEAPKEESNPPSAEV